MILQEEYPPTTNLSLPVVINNDLNQAAGPGFWVFSNRAMMMIIGATILFI